MRRIIDHAWHQGHSYRLHALPALFWYYFVGRRTWDESQRPMPWNFKGFLTGSAWKLDGVNLILSHLDNWCDHRYALRGMPFRLVNLMATMKYPHVPRIAIMHGSPDDEGNRLAISRMIENCPGGPPFVVTNSEQAYREWGLGPERSRPIIHGYDVDEFWSSNSRRVQAITVCSGGNMSREYHGIPMLERIRRSSMTVTWVGERGDVRPLPNYEKYREYLATALIYVHTGQRSPMPGARTEAMLSGCCVVSTRNHDADSYIEHGVSGFLCDSAEAMIETLRMLLSDTKRAYKVGQQGREVARQAFHKDRYVADWLQLLGELGAL